MDEKEINECLSKKLNELKDYSTSFNAALYHLQVQLNSVLNELEACKIIVNHQQKTMIQFNKSLNTGIKEIK